MNNSEFALKDKLPYILVAILIVTLVSFALYIDCFLKCKRKQTNKYKLLENILIVLGGGILVFFSAFRVITLGQGGVDAYVYKLYYLSSNIGLKESLKLQGYEPGYGIIIWIFRKIFTNYEIYLSIVYTFLYSTMLKFLKHIRYTWMTPIIIFLFLMLIFNSFNTIRVLIAVFIGMRIYLLLYKQEFKKAILLIFIAVSIHISAIILLPIFFMVWIINKKDEIKISKIFVYTSIGILIAILSMQFFTQFIGNSKYYMYTNEDGISVGTYLIVIIILLLLSLKYKKVIYKNSFDKILIISLPICLLVIPLQLRYSILYRMTLYFLPVIYSIIPSIIKIYDVKKEWFLNVIVKLGLIGYLCYRIYNFYYIEILSSGLPYVNMLLR